MESDASGSECGARGGLGASEEGQHPPFAQSILLGAGPATATKVARAGHGSEQDVNVSIGCGRARRAPPTPAPKPHPKSLAAPIWARETDLIGYTSINAIQFVGDGISIKGLQSYPSIYYERTRHYESCETGQHWLGIRDELDIPILREHPQSNSYKDRVCRSNKAVSSEFDTRNYQKPPNNSMQRTALRAAADAER